MRFEDHLVVTAMCARLDAGPGFTALSTSAPNAPMLPAMLPLHGRLIHVHVLHAGLISLKPGSLSHKEVATVQFESFLASRCNVCPPNEMTNSLPGICLSANAKLFWYLRGCGCVTTKKPHERSRGSWYLPPVSQGLVPFTRPRS